MPIVRTIDESHHRFVDVYVVILDGHNYSLEIRYLTIKTKQPDQLKCEKLYTVFKLFAYV